MRHTALRFRATPLVPVVCALALAFFAAYATPAAQQAPAVGAKKVLTVDDYAKWKTIAGQEMSSDGKWVAYVLQSANTATTDAKPVLHIQNLNDRKH